jgi:hypothetical protein
VDTNSMLPQAGVPDLAEVLTALLSSRVRYKLLALFVAGQDTPRHARQIAKDAGEHFNSVWQELKHLESLGLLASEKVGSQVRYRTNPSFPLLKELRQLLRKAEGLAAEETVAAEAPSVAPSAEPRPPSSPHRRAAPVRSARASRTVAPFIIGETD